MKNFKAIIKIFSKKLKKELRNMIKKETNEIIEVTGIPNIPANTLEKIENFCSEDYLGYSEFSKITKNNVISELEDKFYKYYLQELIKRKDLNVTIRIEDYLETMRKTKIFGLSDFLEIEKVKDLSYEKIMQELDIKIINIEKIIPQIKKELGFKGCLKIEEFCKGFIEKIVLDFKEFNGYNRTLRETIINAFGLIQIVSFEINSSTYKPVNESLLNKAFGINVEAIDITETMWKSMNIDTKLEIYTACYLLLSEDIYLLRNINTSRFTESLNNCFSPVAQEILYFISKIYPLFEENRPESKKLLHNSRLFMNLIDQVVSSVLPSSRNYFKTIYFNRNSRIMSFVDSSQFSADSCSLSLLNEVKSKHIIICVSGYMSESDDHLFAWEKIIKLFPHSTIYSFLWQSSSYFRFFKNFFNIIGGIKEIYSDFHQCSERAMQSGIILAEMIQSNFLNKGFCVSLYGFSLGTLVLTACMAELRNYQMFSLHQVIYFGSATSVEEASEMSNFKRHVVFARLINVYSRQDYALRYIYKIARDSRACGESQVEGMENIDASHVVNGHLLYRKNFCRIFKMIWGK
jgi:hypothetical protein